MESPAGIFIFNDPLRTRVSPKLVGIFVENRLFENGPASTEKGTTLNGNPSKSNVSIPVAVPAPLIVPSRVPTAGVSVVMSARVKLNVATSPEQEVTESQDIELFVILARVDVNVVFRSIVKDVF
jgi:hypothetical protein